MSWCDKLEKECRAVNKNIKWLKIMNINRTSWIVAILAALGFSFATAETTKAVFDEPTSVPGTAEHEWEDPPELEP